MNYELTEKLYKAGFPGIRCSEESPIPGYNYPTLSELIEACGDRFISLEKRGNIFTAKGFGFSKEGRKSSVNGISYGEIIIWNGYNPNDVVANLWLELNKK